MNTGFFNSNGSVNTGPLSPVWGDSETVRCVGEACNSASVLGVAVFLAVGALVAVVLLSVGTNGAR